MDKAKIKIILRWVFGTLLALFAAMMLLSFVLTAVAKDIFGQRLYSMRAAIVIIWWVVILGAGAPGALLLRGAIKGLKKEDKKYEEDIDDEDDENEDEDEE